MTFALIGMSVIAVLALAAWIMTELDLREAHADTADLEYLLTRTRRERDIAEAFVERDTAAIVDARPTLHLIDGGEA